MVTDVSWKKDKHNYYFDHCIYTANLSLIAFIILELFTVMSWKCRHYTPELCFETVNQET